MNSTNIFSSENAAVLFVDDEHGVLSAIRRLLLDVPWRLHFAESGAAGLEVLRNNPIDLVVSDARMPEMDGIAFLQRVKEGYPEVARILLTGFSDSKSLEEALAGGLARQIILKPWDNKELLEVLQSSLQQVILQRQAGKRIQRVVNALTALPPLSGTYLQLQECLADQNSSPSRVAEIVEKDVAITAELLQWANSAAFGQRRQVDSISRALVLLGIDMVAALVLSIGTNAALPPAGKIRGFDEGRLQNHSLRCATMARDLAVRCLPEQSVLRDRAFTAGLMHDVGKLVAAHFMAADFQKALDRAQAEQMPLFEGEEAEMGVGHADLGGYLTEWWNLPEYLVEAIRWHHRPAGSSSGALLAELVHVADYLAHRREKEERKEPLPPEPDPAALARLHLNLDELVSECGQAT